MVTLDVIVVIVYVLVFGGGGVVWGARGAMGVTLAVLS